MRDQYWKETAEKLVQWVQNLEKYYLALFLPCMNRAVILGWAGDSRKELGPQKRALCDPC